MTTHSNYSLQNFSTNNAKVLTENSQPVLDFRCPGRKTSSLQTVRILKILQTSGLDVMSGRALI